MKTILYIGALLSSVALGRAGLLENDGFADSFTVFAAAAREGDAKRLASFANAYYFSSSGENFEARLNPRWRPSRLVLKAAPRFRFSGGRVIFVEAVIEVQMGVDAGFVTMHWLRSGENWTFLDFPFFGSGILPTHAFANESMVEIVGRVEGEGTHSHRAEKPVPRPNKSLQPTATAVTFPAGAGNAPAVAVAEH